MNNARGFPSHYLFLVAVGPLLTVLRLLAGRATAVGPRDILFLLGFGLYLAIVLRLVTSASEVDAVFENILKIVHININDGIV